MKKKILIPTDFSDNALNAIIYASKLFEHEPCEFFILNAYEVNTYTTTDMMVPEPGHERFEKAKLRSELLLEKVLKKLDFRVSNPNHDYHTISELNLPFESIKRIVDEKDIFMVIMGTRGTSDDRIKLFGSNTIAVMDKMRNCPVLGVPEFARFEGFKEIVFPTNYETPIKSRELSYLVELAKKEQATVHVVHVNERDTLSKRQLNNKQLIEECFENISSKHHLLHGKDATQTTLKFAVSIKSDLICFVNRKHFYFTSLFSKPMVHRLGMNSNIPLLVLHQQSA